MCDKIRLNIGRILLSIGLIIGMGSLFMTFSHIGDTDYILISSFEKGTTHAWYHAFRESIGDISTIVVLIAVFFGFQKWRTSQTWFICAILMFGYYAPFWIGIPFLPELAAPHMKAEIVHISMMMLSVLGLIIARKAFFNVTENISK